MSYIARVIVKTTTISFVPLSERTQLKTVGTWPRRCLEDDLVAYLLAIIARLVGWELGAIDILLVRIGNKSVGSQDAVLVLAVWRKKYFWLFNVNGLDTFCGGIDLTSFVPFRLRAAQFVVQGNM
ncbi:hypothetical protein DL95DRAFT_505883 [Leptodontidium sp. 2 PMI_412]|nr:hypothetical protein DL95DRAFT_505883 [Leptodontidium sp. 2 PMI_412]